ncbi:MAG: YceI family protein [Anaerolineaceae bacterium]|jgi:polyisoprenoid-binding protein YceI
MRRILYLFFAVTFVLSGCSSLVYKIAVPTATPAPASAQSSNANPTPNLSPTTPVTGATSTPSANTVDYKIVPGESQVSYKVQETFINKNNKLNTAIGVTKQVTGDIYGNKNDPSQSKIGTITIDISQFTSDSSMRDNFIRKNFLQSNTYPLATFAPTAIDGMPASYTEGQSYSFKVTGNLTVHNITKPVTFDIAASLSGNTLSGTATAGIKMSDFGVGPITLAGMIQTQDDVALTLKFVARPG